MKKLSPFRTVYAKLLNGLYKHTYMNMIKFMAMSCASLTIAPVLCLFTLLI